MRDLGTLGGPDSAAEVNNDRGEVTGWSYTSFVANPSSGTPNVDPFLWSPEDGKMTDLGSLGGTSDLHATPVYPPKVPRSFSLPRSQRNVQA